MGRIGGIMDTKVEQEVFGYDPTDPEGLDSLHSHIHTDFEELELRLLCDEERSSSKLSQHGEAMAGLTQEQRAAYKATHYLELYGTSGTSLG